MNKFANTTVVSQETFNDWAETICDEFFRTIYSGSITPNTMKHKAMNEINRYVKSCSNCSLTLKSYVISYYAKKRRITMYNMKTQKFTTAQCMDKDVFYFCTAIAICWARMQGWEVPEVGKSKKLNEMQYGEQFYYNGDLYSFIAKVPDGEFNHYAVVAVFNGRLRNLTDYGDYYQMK